MTLETVDMSAWFSGDQKAMDDIARSMDDTMRTTGILAIVGHGIPADLRRGMLDVTQAFFDLPLEQKLPLRVPDVSVNRGYSPVGVEALSYSLGIESPPDLFEAFNVGPEEVPEGVSTQELADFFQPNLWPEAPAGFRTTWLTYWRACEELGRVLLDVFARALDLPDRWFRPFVTRGPSVMRANNYPVQPPTAPPQDGQLRMGAHSDYGSLTILLADPVPGLQIRSPEGQWTDVVPLEDSLVVNIGDLLAEWTNDRWHSTVHRVVPPHGDQPGQGRRRSVAWFQQPNADAIIDVLPSCTSAENPPRYPPTSAGEHLLGKLRGSRGLEKAPVAEQFLDSER